MSYQLAGLTLLVTISIFMTGYGLAQQPSAPRASYSPAPASTLPAAGAVTPSPSLTIPPDAKTPAQRQPAIGVLAVVAIVVAGAAGIYVYRIIRKGL